MQCAMAADTMELRFTAMKSRILFPSLFQTAGIQQDGSHQEEKMSLAVPAD
jgi:hypothetical protein